MATVHTPTAPTGIKKYMPILEWLPAYQRAWLRTDLIAGLTAAAVVIPQAMAYATIAGLPVQVGLYVALTPMLVYALLGSSRRLSVSSTSPIAILSGTVLLNTVGPASSPSDYIVPAATLAFLVGVFLVLASLLRLGFLADFISKPVLAGFLAGVGVVIITGQLGKVLGLSVPSGPTLQTLGTVLTSLNQINWPTTLLSAATLAILIFLPRLVARLPAALVAVAFGIALSALFNLPALGITLVGEVPSGLPSFSPPDLSLVSNLWLPAIGIALLAFTESSAMARSFRKYGEPIPEANQELVAIGMANIAGGLFQAFPASGGESQTAVNANAGAKTQVAALVTVGVVVLVLLFLAPVIALMPEATLGAMLMVAGAGLIDIGKFRDMAKIRRTELIWAMVAFTGVVVLGVLEGILIAILFSLLTLLAQVDRPPVYAIPYKGGSDGYGARSDQSNDESSPGLLIARTEGRLFFANAPGVIDKLWTLVHQASPKPKVLILECDAVPDIEYTAITALIEFEQQLHDADIEFWLASLNPGVLPLVRRTPLGKQLGNERIYGDLDQAVDAFLKSAKSGAAGNGKPTPDE